MGFNNHGIDAMIRNIENSRFKGILGINIGKNAVTPIENAADDYLICLEKAYAHASYITVNISSPNTKNLRALQGGDELSALLEALKNKQAQLAAAHGKYVPLAVKIAPDLDEAQIDDIAHVVNPWKGRHHRHQHDHRQIKLGQPSACRRTRRLERLARTREKQSGVETFSGTH